MTRKYVIIVIIIGAALSLLRSLPLAWVAPHVLPASFSNMLTYNGTLWNGDISWPGSGLPPLQLTTHPLGLISGGPVLKFQAQRGAVSQENALNLTGALTRNGLDKVTLTAPVAALLAGDGRLYNLQGHLDVSVQSLTLNAQKTGCRSVEGRVQTDILERNARAWQWTGPALSGPILCNADGQLSVALVGEDADQHVNVDLRLGTEDTYVTRIRVKTQQPEAAALLPLYGFEWRETEFVLSETGRWR